MNTNLTKLVHVEKELRVSSSLSLGGKWEPAYCKSESKLALIVPHRDRYNNLVRFMRHMHPFLMRQQVAYKIYVTEPLSGLGYNKALSMNAAFVEASKEDHYDCYIFHDVDMLPENDGIVYQCNPEAPTHFVVALNIRNYT